MQIKSSLESPYSCSSEQRTRVIESSVGYVSFFDPATESYTSLTKEQNRKLYVDFLTVSMLALAAFVGLLTPYLIYTSYSKYYTEAQDKVCLEDLFWSTSFVAIALIIFILGIDINHFRLGLLSRKDPNETYLYILTLVVYIILLLGDLLSATIVFYKLCSRPHLQELNRALMFLLWFAFVVINLVVHFLTFHSVFIIMTFLVSPFEVLLNLIFYTSCVLSAISLIILFFRVKRSNADPCFKWFKLITLSLFSLFLVLTLYAINQLILHLSRNTAFSEGKLPQLLITLIPALLLNSLPFTLLQWFMRNFSERQN